MPDITVKDFRVGLDLRKFRLSLPAGTLLVANNGHINQGGEFEKRKAFIRLANSSGAVSTSLPAGTFGWQPVAAGHLVFGSADGSALTFPTGVTYQRLRHPDGATAMSSVVYSTVFGGSAWVLAKFADGNVFAYYNGTLIADFYSGYVWSGNNTNASIATNLSGLISGSGLYSVTTISSGIFNVASIPTPSSATPYTIASTIEANNGSVASQLLSLGTPSAPAIAPTGQIQIVAGTSNPAATGTLTSNNTAVLANDTVTIGSTTYKFVSSFSGVANEILIQSTPDNTLAALAAAVNNDAGAGVTYSSATQKNTQVTAGAVTAHALVFTAIVGGTPGNSIGTTTTANPRLAWGAATLAGGGADTNKVTQIAVGAVSLLAAYVQYNQTNAQTASDICSAINSNASVSGFTASAVGSVITIQPATAGSSFNGSAIKTTCAGNVCVDNCSFTVTGLVANTSNISAIDSVTTVSSVTRAANVATITVANTGALAVGDTVTVAGCANAGYNATVTLTAVTTNADGTHTISYANVGANQAATADTTGTVTLHLMTSTITYRDGTHTTETGGAFVGRIATNVNANSAASGWLAYSDGANATLFLSKVIRSSADQVPGLSVTNASTTVTPNAGNAFQLAASTQTLTVSWAQSGLTAKTGNVTVAASGGTGPYTFKWTFVSNSTQGKQMLTASAVTSPTTYFTCGNHTGLPATEVWQCSVTDTASNQASIQVGIYIPSPSSK